jgi:hypothetical protein
VFPVDPPGNIVEYRVSIADSACRGARWNLEPRARCFPASTSRWWDC